MLKLLLQNATMLSAFRPDTSKPCSHGAVVMESRFKISWENVDCKTGERQRFYFPWQLK